MPKKPSELTKKAAARRLGVSVRSLERLVQNGRLRSGLRSGKRAMEAFFIASDLDALKAEHAAEREKAVTEPVKRESASLTKTERLPTQLRHPSDVMAWITAVLRDAPPRPMALSELRQKFTLTIAEAAQLSELPVTEIRRLVKSRELFAIRTGAGWRIPVKVLETFFERIHR